jgi:hypothetical protein
MTRVSRLVGLIAIVAVHPATAQDAAAPPVGSRVKVYAPTHLADTAVAVVLGYAPETLTLRRLDGGDTLVVPYSAIACVQVRHTHTLVFRGLAVGLLMGGGVGALVGSIGPGCAAHECQDDGDRVVRNMARIGVAGGIVGFVLGALSTTETWDTVPPSCLKPIADSR